MDKVKLKTRLGAFSTFVGTIIVTVIVTALIKGESLAGLIRLKTLLPFLKTSVPLWLLLVVLVACVWMLPSVLREKRPKKPKLHVSWERISCLWALGKFGKVEMMQIQGDAIVSSSGTDEGIILREAFVKGTKPLMNLVDSIQIMPGEPLPCRIVTMVAPVIRKPDEGLEANLILRDHKGRE